ncbi:hypothetical protein [Brevibacterium album]|uniref:hypothetical protein n=1 Tax=Brevibacterium album TaxID=417948 RepID=UPI0003F7A9C5|nr:hypothetical protein [Brevibacterium album]
MTAGPDPAARLAAFAGSHLLLLDAELEPHDVISLLRNIRPQLPAGEPVPGEGAVRSHRITRHSQLVGPFPADAELAAGLGLPPGTAALYALECPRDREPVPPPAWLPDVDGLLAAFPAGLPCREEGRVLDELIAIARRLGLAIRLADEPAAAPEEEAAEAQAGPGARAAASVPRASGQPPRLLRPDPALTPNLFVYSEYWLDPAVLLARVARTVPQARLPRPPAPRAHIPDAQALGTGLSPDDPVVLDGYAIEVPLEDELGPRAGRIEIQVTLETHLPTVIRAHSAASEQIVYSVLWQDAEGLGRLPTADPAFAELRARAVRVLERCAQTIMHAVAGAGVDEAGFLVSAQQLGD